MEIAFFLLRDHYLKFTRVDIFLTNDISTLIRSESCEIRDTGYMIGSLEKSFNTLSYLASKYEAAVQLHFCLARWGWANVLFYPFPKRQMLDSSKLKVFADKNLNFDENGRIFFKTGRRHCWKKEKLLVSSISTFLTMFSKDLYCRHVNTRACFGEG